MMQRYIAELKERLAFFQHPYLVALRDGRMHRDDFLETQIQFFFAVVFFSRPMAALAGRMPRPDLRRTLLDNIDDEHGGHKAGASHEQTFRILLGRLGVKASEVEARALWPEVRAFNTTLTGLAVLDDLRTGMAAFGIIESLFAGVSAHLGRSIVLRGFLPKAEVVHYATHESLDEEHAEGFFAGLSASYETNARHRYQVDQGLELGGYLFYRLYEGLWTQRQRRWRRDVTGPHSLADGW